MHGHSLTAVNEYTAARLLCTPKTKNIKVASKQMIWSSWKHRKDEKNLASCCTIYTIHGKRNDKGTFSFSNSDNSMSPLVSGVGTELEAMLICSWRDEYISNTVSRRNLSAPWAAINETETGRPSCFPNGTVTWNQNQQNIKATYDIRTGY